MAVKEQFAQECFDFFREVTEKQDFGSVMASYTSTCLTKEVVYLSTLFTTKFLGGQKEPFVNFKGTPRISNYNWRNFFVKLNLIWRHFRFALAFEAQFGNCGILLLRQKLREIIQFRSANWFHEIFFTRKRYFVEKREIHRSQCHNVEKYYETRSRQTIFREVTWLFSNFFVSKKR